MNATVKKPISVRTIIAVCACVCLCMCAFVRACVCACVCVMCDMCFPGLPLFSGAADSVDKSLLLHLNHLQLILYHLSRILTPLLLLLTSSPLTTDDPLLANLSTFYVTATTSHMVISCFHSAVPIPILVSVPRSQRSRYGVYGMAFSPLALVWHYAIRLHHYDIIKMTSLRHH